MIAVIAAMEQELSGIVDTDILHNAVNNAFPYDRTSTPYPYIIDEDRQTIFVLSGIGKINAAGATQWVLCNYPKVDTIINFGTAGSISKDVSKGSIFIVNSCVTADFDLSAFGKEKGYVFGIGTFLMTKPSLVKEIKKITAEMYPSKEVPVVFSRIATTDTFISDREIADKIAKKFSADGCDMECSAIAQITMINNVDFISIKKISDRVGSNGTEDFKALVKDTKYDIAKEAREIVEELINRLNNKDNENNY